jgi:hypothetical protein
MREESTTDELMLPSIKSFEKQWRLPKTHFILYDSFYKAVIREGVWKERCNDNTRRLSTMIAETYTLAMVCNHYFA